ncbi:MAG: EAL domain-containing protein [Hydrogenophilaceae bacterium]|nr:EAL domain-containing protein [Hydrogenophilaceae bacterium]
MALLAATTVLHGEWVVGQMQAAVAEHSQKLSLANSMYSAARERSFNAVTMILSADKAKADALIQRHSALASEYMAAREQLLALPLNAQERSLMDQQFELSASTAPLLNESLDLFIMGDVEAARRLLIYEILPRQNRLLEVLSRQAELQHAAMQTLLTRVEDSQREHRLLVSGVGALALALAIIVAVYISRRLALAEDHVFAKTTLEAVTEAVVVTDPQQRVRYINPAAERLTGLALDQAVDRPVGELLKLTPPEQPGYPFKLTKQNGHVVDVEYAVSDIHGHDRHLGAVWVLHDVTYTLTIASQLAYQASHDPLTGLPNRRAFELALEETLKANRTQPQSHVVGFLDLDMFKIVNDSCGHAAGDELLKQVGRLFQDKMRASDLLARLGGDEFGFLLRGCGIEDAKKVAESLLAAVRDYRFNWNGRPFTLGASIGLSAIEEQTTHSASVIKQADSACYAAKDRGRNQVCVYSASDSEETGRRDEMEWAARIQTALHEDRFVLYGQPIIMLDNTPPSDIRKVEILVRMLDQEDKLIPPGAFMPAAERFNLMPAVDRWVIRHALAWAGSEVGRQYTHIAINLSGASVANPDLYDFIVEQINATGANPAVLCFEITESAAMSNFKQCAACIQSLREMGCKFALDDFGTGIASFSYLKNLGMDYLKIDGNYIREMQYDLYHFSMTEAIHRVGHAMGLKTMAAFVETEESLNKLKALGVDYAQGYKIAAPQPLDSLN